MNSLGQIIVNYKRLLKYKVRKLRELITKIKVDVKYRVILWLKMRTFKLKMIKLLIKIKIKSVVNKQSK